MALCVIHSLRIGCCFVRKSNVWGDVLWGGCQVGESLLGAKVIGV